ncbi:hypothetical protein GCM10027275_16330 [Rhabdobacter roseus]|uniref:Uncharacterized protein n=1 Tax=Rhabdobacter roseus TaxID=1655419 RepID=A0A840TJE0_9BACT|nr:hypothetical protein [Rhabdobacter roseus]MBB5283554.1 hypothetical protein [Rhabdobacter roseus]
MRRPGVTDSFFGRPQFFDEQVNSTNDQDEGGRDDDGRAGNQKGDNPDYAHDDFNEKIH